MREKAISTFQERIKMAYQILNAVQMHLRTNLD